MDAVYLTVESSAIAIAGTATIKVNAERGAAYQSEVRSQLEATYSSDRYTIIENKALRDVNRRTVKIDGHYVRPDFQVWDKVTRRIVAIHEAKTGLLSYLTGKGQQVLSRYRLFASKLGYEAPPVIAEYRARPAPGRWLERAGRAFNVLMLVPLLFDVANGHDPWDLCSYDPDRCYVPGPGVG